MCTLYTYPVNKYEESTRKYIHVYAYIIKSSLCQKWLWQKLEQMRFPVIPSTLICVMQMLSGN